MTHHGTGDVAILRTLPGMEIVVPGTPDEFDTLFREAYADGAPTYFRLSARRNAEDRPVRFGRLDVVRQGSRGTVLAVGPMLDVHDGGDGWAGPDRAATRASIAPFDAEVEGQRDDWRHRGGRAVLLAGALVPDVAAALRDRRTPSRASGCRGRCDTLRDTGTS